MTLYELQPKKSENISDFFDYIYESLKNKFNNEELASQMAVEFGKLRETAINYKLCGSALLDNLKCYHDQLVLLGGKIRFSPENCNVSFKWFCSYSPRGSDKEVYELCNIDWEFANVLFNIAILTYLKGKKESQKKQREEAKKCFQEAAGIILFLKDHQLKKINRRTNDLNDHALELIFNSFVGYVQLEVAKKSMRRKSKRQAGSKFIRRREKTVQYFQYHAKCKTTVSLLRLTVQILRSDEQLSYGLARRG
ncbi:unnamed protein product [Oikopleura dioica]|uniref:BRO1 domain-containing protein n=1 Tax=Oikopleura dioica TaxID=34765 RepID=E4YMJ4_OIKDI|nr:unnamed protein product [Oikopleura dioica]